MSLQSARPIPSLHWLVDEDNRLFALNLRGAKVFCFFGSRLNADTFRRVLDKPSDWILVGNRSADYLIELCERARKDIPPSLSIPRLTTGGGSRRGRWKSSRMLSNAPPRVSEVDNLLYRVPVQARQLACSQAAF
jgi:hypothetical protein